MAAPLEAAEAPAMPQPPAPLDDATTAPQLPAIPEARDGRVQLVVISMGGPRKHAMLSCYERRFDFWDVKVARKAFGNATPDAVAGFDLTFVPGVLGEMACTRKRLEAHAGDVLDALGLDDAQRDVFAERAKLARPPNRKVMGCLLANLRAMRVAAASPNALVVEDNARAAAVGAVDACADALAAGGDVDLLYFGHLAHDDTMDAVARAPRDAGGLAALPEPREAPPAPKAAKPKKGKQRVDAPAKNHELWGTFAYRASPKLYEAVLAHVREGFPGSLFRPRRRDCDVVPVDKLLQRVARANGCALRALAPPAFFRMPPALPSKIHKKWDAAFAASTSLQLSLYGRTWADVWLTGHERAIVAPPEEESKEAVDDDEDVPPLSSPVSCVTC